MPSPLWWLMLFIVRTQVLGTLCTQVLCHLPQIYISSQAEHTQTKTTQDTLHFDKNLVLSSPDIWTGLDWTGLDGDVFHCTLAACSPHLSARLSAVTWFLSGFHIGKKTRLARFHSICQGFQPNIGLCINRKGERGIAFSHICKTELDHYWRDRNLYIFLLVSGTNMAEKTWTEWKYR